ncbi:hypothetical protein EV643_107239 [Kribbella sp. VKM Ac-2527]|uniref:Uncharacterized protein n=1 Tax=Kribbella caucasensis TaxID=2512215 RepID=A0A4R6KGM6_9ACTN|nr:hypothetical protein [Kribbella sp. VKM Ac-2527]TDO48609.1 hypothetical protein EV643_107239 [Kribbella sp. VKM Ac-2527]
MSPYRNLPAIHSFCVARLEESHRAGDAEALKLRARLETAVHALRTLDPDAWWQAEDDIRAIAARYTTHPEYPPSA